MAILDGASHPELVSMAGCANWGEQAGNAHKNVMAAFCADIQISPPVSIQVEVMDAKTSLESVEEATLFAHARTKGPGKRSGPFYQDDP